MKTQAEINAENAEANRRAAEVTDASNPHLADQRTQAQRDAENANANPNLAVHPTNSPDHRASASGINEPSQDAQGRVLQNPLTTTHDQRNVATDAQRGAVGDASLGTREFDQRSLDAQGRVVAGSPPAMVSDVERAAAGERVMAEQRAGNPANYPANAQGVKTREAVKQGLGADGVRSAGQETRWNVPVTAAREAELRVNYGTSYSRAVELYNNGLDDGQVQAQIEFESRDASFGVANAAFHRRDRSMRGGSSGIGSIVLYGDGSGAVYPAIVTYVYDSEDTTEQSAQGSKTGVRGNVNVSSSEAGANVGSNVGMARDTANTGNNVNTGKINRGVNATGANGRVDLQVFKRQYIVNVENVASHSPDDKNVLNGWTKR